VTTTRGLADEHPRGSPRSASTTAASATARRQAALIDRSAARSSTSAKLAVRQPAVCRTRGRGGGAGSEALVGGDCTGARAAARADRASVPGLRAKGRRLARAAARTVSRRALGGGRARVADRGLRRVERGALSPHTAFAAAFAIRPANFRVRRTRWEVAHPSDAIAAATIRVRHACGTETQASAIADENADPQTPTARGLACTRAASGTLPRSCAASRPLHRQCTRGAARALAGSTRASGAARRAVAAVGISL
jgi:hypothetical protein